MKQAHGHRTHPYIICNTQLADSHRKPVEMKSIHKYIKLLRWHL